MNVSGMRTILNNSFGDYHELSVDFEMTCVDCDKFTKETSLCKYFGTVPPQFVRVGCESWELVDVPFLKGMKNENGQ